MKKIAPALLAISALIFSHAANAQPVEAKTVPVGVVTVNIAAGTGTNKVRSLIAAPLLGAASIAGKQAGRITSVSAASISSANAGWSPGALSSTSAPFIIRITSGAAEGLTLLVSNQTANTADTITIDSGDASFVNLTQQGILVGDNVGDTFEIYPCDTLLSFLGDPSESGVLDGTSAANADTLTITNTFGAPQTFFYSTPLGRWTRVALGSPDGSAFPIRPDSGILYLRLGNTPMTLSVTGSVPSTDRLALVKASGVSYLANSWPTSITLTQSNIQNIPGWVSSATAANADLVTIGTQSYFYDGANWRRVALGSPVSNPVIDVGVCVLINKKGTSTSSVIVDQNIPYQL